MLATFAPIIKRHANIFADLNLPSEELEREGVLAFETADGDNLAHLVCREGDTTMLAHLLNLAPPDWFMNAENLSGHTPLQVALMRSSPGTVVLLLVNTMESINSPINMVTGTTLVSDLFIRNRFRDLRVICSRFAPSISWQQTDCFNKTSSIYAIQASCPDEGSILLPPEQDMGRYVATESIFLSHQLPGARKILRARLSRVYFGSAGPKTVLRRLAHSLPANVVRVVHLNAASLDDMYMSARLALANFVAASAPTSPAPPSPHFSNVWLPEKSREIRARHRNIKKLGELDNIFEQLCSGVAYTVVFLEDAKDLPVIWMRRAPFNCRLVISGGEHESGITKLCEDYSADAPITACGSLVISWDLARPRHITSCLCATASLNRADPISWRFVRNYCRHQPLGVKTDEDFFLHAGLWFFTQLENFRCASTYFTRLTDIVDSNSSLYGFSALMLGRSLLACEEACDPHSIYQPESFEKIRQYFCIAYGAVMGKSGSPPPLYSVGDVWRSLAALENCIKHVEQRRSDERLDNGSQELIFLQMAADATPEKHMHALFEFCISPSAAHENNSIVASTAWQALAAMEASAKTIVLDKMAYARSCLLNVVATTSTGAPPPLLAPFFAADSDILPCVREELEGAGLLPERLTEQFGPIQDEAVRNLERLRWLHLALVLHQRARREEQHRDGLFMAELKLHIGIMNLKLGRFKSARAALDFACKKFSTIYKTFDHEDVAYEIAFFFLRLRSFCAPLRAIEILAPFSLATKFHISFLFSI